jgi:hypothetical protein
MRSQDLKWGSWKELPDGSTTDAALATAIVTEYLGDEELYVFGKGIGPPFIAPSGPPPPHTAPSGPPIQLMLPDRRIFVNSLPQSSHPVEWTGWSEVPHGNIPGMTDAALAVTAKDSTLWLFAKGIADKKIYVNTLRVNQYEPEGHFNVRHWSGWVGVEGDDTTDTAVAAVASGADGYLNLIFKGIDGGIYWNRHNMQRWIGSAELPGGWRTDASPAATATVGTSGADAKMLVFIKGLDQHIYMNVYTFSLRSWTGWTEVGGITDVGLGACAVPGTVLLFAKGRDDAGIYCNAFDLKGWTWSGWSEVGGHTDAPLATVAGVNIVRLFAKGINIPKVYVNGVWWGAA